MQHVSGSEADEYIEQNDAHFAEKRGLYCTSIVQTPTMQPKEHKLRDMEKGELIIQWW